MANNNDDIAVKDDKRVPFIGGADSSLSCSSGFG